jgi:hypothetical protein
MKNPKKLLCFLFLNCFVITILHAQATNPATGENGSGSGGSVSYTVDQVTYSSLSGTNGTLAKGIQRPFEISVITAIKSAEGINLECVVCPNPTRARIKLVVRAKDLNDLRFQLYDLNGVLFQEKKLKPTKLKY